MAFKTNNASSGGTYLSFDEQFINADNTTANGYDATTLPSNETKIIASDVITFDAFGDSVAVGSGRIVVGAPGDDDNGNGSGSVYTYDLDGNELTKITASDAGSYDQFGRSVAVGSGRIVVGAFRDDDAGSDSGSAYVFDLDGNELTKITASDAASFDNFGYSVAVGSGRIVVGARFDLPNGSGANTAGTGSAYIFDLDGNQLAKITASDRVSNALFSESISVGSGRIVVGSGGESAYVFDLDGNELTKITASDAGAFSDLFGRPVAVGSGRIVVGARGDNDAGSDSGSAYVYDLDGNELTKITASDAASGDLFGVSVSVGSGRICVGARGDDNVGFDSGSAYVYDLDGNQLTKITASDAASGDLFGRPVAVGSGRIAIGSPLDDDNGTSSGSAYIYDLGEDYNTYIESIIDTKQV